MAVCGFICGNVHYEIGGKSLVRVRREHISSTFIYWHVCQILCHCVNCRETSASTYGSYGVYDADQFKINKGTPEQYKQVADGGSEISSTLRVYNCQHLKQHFTDIYSGNCGSTMWRGGAFFSGKRIIREGTLDDTSILINSQVFAELYTDARPKWIVAQRAPIR